jgi:5'-nucleotidase/UDP-sugar diphosphatase
MKNFFCTTVMIGFLISGLTAQPKTITILHTNDMHASFIPHEAFWVKESPKPLVGGFNELSFAVDSVRKVKTNSILIDAGDVMTGNPVTEYEYKGAQGGILFEMMNRLGYEVWTPGNHDFDISQNNLRSLIAIAKFPVVSANLVKGSGGFPVNNKEYTIIEKNGVRIGIIGVMTEGLYNLVNQTNLVDIKVLPTITTTQKFIDELTPKTDLIIAMTHQGVEDDSVLAANVKGLNVIIGGHSHTRLKKPKNVNGVLIAQAGSNCENLGILDLTVENHVVTKSWGVLLPLNYTSDRPKTELSKLIDSVSQKIDKDYSEVIGTLKSDWTRGNGETGIGNFIADAQREAVHADVAFMNNHGIRKNVTAGPLTKRDLFEVLPFRNVLVTFQLSGKEIKDLLRNYIDNRASIQTSGIMCTWKRNGNNEIEFVSLKINGKAIDDNRSYIAAASDYLVGEGKRYLNVEIKNPAFLQQTVFAAVEKKVLTEKNIDSKTENRIQEVK